MQLRYVQFVHTSKLYSIATICIRKENIASSTCLMTYSNYNYTGIAPWNPKQLYIHVDRSRTGLSRNIFISQSCYTANHLVYELLRKSSYKSKNYVQRYVAKKLIGVKGSKISLSVCPMIRAIQWYQFYAGTPSSLGGMAHPQNSPLP